MPKHTVIRSRNDRDNLFGISSNIIVTDFRTPANPGSHTAKLGRSRGVPALANYHDERISKIEKQSETDFMSIRKVDKRSSLIKSLHVSATKPPWFYLRTERMLA